jgi:large conductance mechanosensitive channel
MLSGFREFILRGNVMDLAIAVVMGTAFTAVVTALVDGIIMPLVAAIFAQPDISAVGNFTLNGAEFSIGSVLQAVLNFLLIALAVYFVLVLPMKHLMERFKKPEEEAAEEANEQTILLTEIRDALRTRQH